MFHECVVNESLSRSIESRILQSMEINAKCTTALIIAFCFDNGVLFCSLTNFPCKRISFLISLFWLGNTAVVSLLEFFGKPFLYGCQVLSKNAVEATLNLKSNYLKIRKNPNKSNCIYSTFLIYLQVLTIKSVSI